MGWIRSIRCEKLQRNFLAQTFVLIEPVQYVLQQVSCSYQTIPNAPKYYETHRNISFGSNGPVQYLLQQVSCSYERIPNGPKYYETDRNISFGSNGVDWVHSLRKIPM